MAEGRDPVDDDGSWWCTICEVNLKFKSKFDRHIKTSKHLALAGVRFIDSVGGHSDDEGDVNDGGSVQLDDHHSNTFSSHLGDEADMFSPENSGREEDTDVDERQQDELQHEEEFDWGGMMEVDTPSTNFSPFPSKLFALMFILLNSPRPLGESNLKFVWYIMKHLDPTIPSLAQVKGFTLPSFHNPVKCYSSQGVPFYINTPSETLRKCLGNPELASMLQRYPVETGDDMRELWHGRRWRNDPLYQAPMVETEVAQVFVGDFIATAHPQEPHLGIILAKVLRFYMKEHFDDIFASVEVLLSLDQFCRVCPRASALYCDPVSVVQHNVREIDVSNITAVVQPPSVILKWDPSTCTLQRMSMMNYTNYVEPHPLKLQAHGQPVVVVPLITYTDDTSGNRSKKWNKFDCWCFLLAGLPHHENAKLQNIHFITCSNEVSVLDMADPVVPDFLLLEQGIEMYDAYLEKDVLVLAHTLIFIGDNPRHSELLNHLGGQANKYCRMCLVNRNENPTEIATLRTKELALFQMQDIAHLPSESAKQARRTEYGMKEDPNPLFALSLDIFRSAPVESLHTILLGPYKYLLKVIMSKISARQKKEVLGRMSAFNYSGFDGKVLGNVVYHNQSFVGRDYKAWAQMAPFIIGSYLNNSQKQVWLGLSKVFRIVYCLPFSEQMADEYQQICQEFLHTVQECQPELLRKRKIHILLHLVDNMKDFGPCCGFNTERCESFNGLMRTHNIYANKAAPSRDIAKSFAVIEHIRFICSGGTSSCSDSPAGAGLVQLFSSDEMQTFVNGATAKALHPEKAIYQPGTLRKKHKTMPLGDVHVPVGDASKQLHVVAMTLNLSLPEHISLVSTVTVYGAVMTQQQQLVKPGQYVRFSSDTEQEQYALLLACVAKDHQWYCLIRTLEAMSNVDEPITNDFECPLLTLTDTVFLVPPHSIQVAVSIIHQCTETCQFTESGISRRIEREEITINSRRSLLYKHDWSNTLYCLNIFCMNQ